MGDKWVIEGHENGGGLGTQNNNREVTLAKRRDTCSIGIEGKNKTTGVKVLFCVTIF